MVSARHAGPLAGQSFVALERARLEAWRAAHHARHRARLRAGAVAPPFGQALQRSLAVLPAAGPAGRAPPAPPAAPEIARVPPPAPTGTGGAESPPPVPREGRSRGSRPAPAASLPADGLQVRRAVVQPGDTLWRLAIEHFQVDVSELARQNGITDPTRLRPGQELVGRRRVDAAPRPVVASWYGPGFDGRPMANGEPYDRHAATVAHKTLPLGTRVTLENPDTGARVTATVTDRGPYVAGRSVDLSYRLARQLGVLEPGVRGLLMQVLP